MRSRGRILPTGLAVSQSRSLSVGLVGHSPTTPLPPDSASLILGNRRLFPKLKIGHLRKPFLLEQDAASGPVDVPPNAPLARKYRAHNSLRIIWYLLSLGFIWSQDG